MLEMWTNFVKYLDPTPGPGGPDLGGTRWEQGVFVSSTCRIQKRTQVFVKKIP